MGKIFYDILDTERKKILPLFVDFKKEFYLAGGTSLALQIGHRDSIDFDFFTHDSFSTGKLFERILKIFNDHKIQKIQEEENTLTVSVGNKIKISFFAYPYKLIGKLVDTKDIRLASVADIGCMKLSAIVGRATIKDYIDLYFILHKISLRELIVFASRKFESKVSTNLILKSLVYFEDVQEEPLIFKHNNKVTFPKVKSYLCKEVERYLRVT